MNNEMSAILIYFEGSLLNFFVFYMVSSRTKFTAKGEGIQEESVYEAIVCISRKMTLFTVEQRRVRKSVS